MRITIGNTSTYIRIAYDHFLDYRISEQLYQIKRDESKVTKSPISTIESSNFAITSSNSYYSTLLFSALAIESFINLFGMRHLPNGLFEKHLDYLPVRSKWIAFIRLVFQKDIEKGKEPYQSIDKLFKVRDKIVHDKPMDITSSDDYPKYKHNFKFTPEDAFKTLIITEEYLMSITKPSEGYFLVPAFYDVCFKEWQKGNHLVISSPLPFQGAKIPSLLQYRRYLSIKYGLENIKFEEDKKNNKIVPKQ